MDGKQLTFAVLNNIDDYSIAGRETHQRRIYECLDQACALFCRETRMYKSTATLVTVAAQQDYHLPPGFIDLWMQKPDGQYFLRYFDGTDTYWPVVVPWPSILRLNLTTNQETPSRLCIRDRDTSETNISGTASVAGTSVHGLSILQDTSKHFTGVDRVWPRDIINNETGGSDGYVIAVTDDTHLTTALFDGSRNQWKLNDAYTIIPATEKQLTLEAPAATSSHHILVPYIAMPDPVYSDYSQWRLPAHVCLGIAAGAAAIMQLAKNSYDETRVMNGQFFDEIQRAKREMAQLHLRSAKRPAGSGW